jgi:trigger factor
MSYTYEKLAKNKVKAVFTVSKADWDNATQKSYEENKSKFNIQGFRKGKAPRRVIEKQFGEGVFFDDALDIIFSEEYHAFLEKETTVSPINNPEIKIEKFDENGLIINAEIEVLPEVVLGDYKGLTVEKSKAKVKKDDIEAEIESARQKQARFVEVSGKQAKMGDFVTIDFSGSIDGVKFDGGAAKDYRLELGSKTFIDNFEEQMLE